MGKAYLRSRAFESDDLDLTEILDCPSASLEGSIVERYRRIVDAQLGIRIGYEPAVDHDGHDASHEQHRGNGENAATAVAGPSAADHQFAHVAHLPQSRMGDVRNCIRPKNERVDRALTGC